MCAAGELEELEHGDVFWGELLSEEGKKCYNTLHTQKISVKTVEAQHQIPT